MEISKGWFISSSSSLTERAELNQCRAQIACMIVELIAIHFLTRFHKVYHSVSVHAWRVLFELPNWLYLGRLQLQIFTGISFLVLFWCRYLHDNVTTSDDKALIADLEKNIIKRKAQLYDIEQSLPKKNGLYLQVIKCIQFTNSASYNSRYK